MNGMLTRLARTACTVGLLAGCADSGPTAPPEPPPQPGVLSLRLATPNTDDGALLLTLAGPGQITAISRPPASSYVVHSRLSGTTVSIAIFGDLKTGEVLRFEVPDVEKLASYEASVREVADRGNEPRASTSGYSLTLLR